MQIGKIIGTAVSTKKDEKLENSIIRQEYYKTDSQVPDLTRPWAKGLANSKGCAAGPPLIMWSGSYVQKLSPS